MLEIFSKLFSRGKDNGLEKTGVVNQPEVKKDDEVLFKDKSNIGSKIDRCKELADPEKYFSLFDKHIPKLAADGDGKKIALIDLSNLSVDEKIIKKNIKAEYWLFDNDLDGELLKMLVPEAEIHVCDGEINVEMYNMVSKDMKFDVVVGNPPYDKSLHLKILKETMEHVDFEKGGEIVWLAPIRWLQDPLANLKNSAYKKYIDIRNHIVDLFQISGKNAQKVFSGTIMNMDLGVYHLSKSNIEFTNDSLIDPIVKKVFSNIKCFPEIEFDKNDGWRVRMPLILGGKSGGSGYREINLLSFGKLLAFENGKKDGKWWYEWYRANQHTKKTETLTSSIKFDSEIEANNFINSLNTKFGRYYENAMIVDVHVNSKMVLWMQDYTKPWTDERFYEYFKLTPEEIKLIEDTIKD